MNIILTVCQLKLSFTPPIDAIETAPDAVWMLQTGHIECGCETYNESSRSYQIDLAIYFRTKDSGFTMFFDEGNCQ